jgi:hypothetical protein
LTEKLFAGHEVCPQLQNSRKTLPRSFAQRKRHRAELYALNADPNFAESGPDPFGVSPRMAPWLKAFNAVVVNHFKFRHASPLRVQQFDLDEGPINGILPQRPNARDFLVDVQLVSRRVLAKHPALLLLFTTVILNGSGLRWHRVPIKVQQLIAQRIGEAFISAGLTPAKYFRVIRRKRKVR